MQRFPTLLIWAATGFACLGAEPTFTVDATSAVGKVSPLHYGLMTEEINHSYDGGLYAELIRNRAFLDNAQTPDHWSVVQGDSAAATIALDPAQPLNDKIPTSLRLTVTAASTSHPGTVWFSLVSLFPPTWKDRPNGFRKDLMQMLIDMKPRFLRFPGGNYLEGNTIEARFDWKKTLGPLDQRPGHPCPWGYRSTDGMGLLEFLLWC